MNFSCHFSNSIHNAVSWRCLDRVNEQAFFQLHYGALQLTVCHILEKIQASAVWCCPQDVVVYAKLFAEGVRKGLIGLKLLTPVKV